MEQKILVFYKETVRGAALSAMVRAKVKSQELAEEGWFVHDTCATIHETSERKIHQEVMVTYRRKA